MLAGAGGLLARAGGVLAGGGGGVIVAGGGAAAVLPSISDILLRSRSDPSSDWLMTDCQ